MENNNERKRLVWSAKRGLFRLPAKELFELAMDIPGAPDQEQAKLRLTPQDEEGCFNFVC